MQYQILALDIDNTLLNTKKEITPRVRDALYAAHEKGVTIALVTGRMYRAMLPVVEDLGLSDVPCIACGGAHVWQDGKLIYERAVPSDLAKDFLDWAAGKGWHTQIYIWDDFCYEKENEYAHEYAVTFGYNGVEIPQMRKFTRIDSPKILVIDEEENVTNNIAEAKARYGNKLAFSRSRARYMEVNNVEGNKAAAVDFLAKSKGLTAENVIAMGDATIDLPMIEYAGLGVAMENACDETKAGANIVCPSCDDDGVACVVEEYILNA